MSTIDAATQAAKIDECLALLKKGDVAALEERLLAAKPSLRPVTRDEMVAIDSHWARLAQLLAELQADHAISPEQLARANRAIVKIGLAIESFRPAAPPTRVPPPAPLEPQADIVEIDPVEQSVQELMPMQELIEKARIRAATPDACEQARLDALYVQEQLKQKEGGHHE
jgi:hypothetical protein